MFTFFSNWCLHFRRLVTQTTDGYCCMSSWFGRNFIPLILIYPYASKPSPFYQWFLVGKVATCIYIYPLLKAYLKKEWQMVIVKLCEMMRLEFFSPRPRLFELLDCKIKIETSKCVCTKESRLQNFQNRSKNETANHMKYDYKFARPFTTPYNNTDVLYTVPWYSSYYFIKL